MVFAIRAMDIVFVHRTVGVDYVISMVLVTVVKIHIGDTGVTNHVHSIVKGMCVINIVKNVPMAASKDGTEINVNTAVTKTVCGKLVDKAMDYVPVDALIFIMEVNVRRPVVFSVASDVAAETGVHVPDVVTDILVCLVNITAVQTVPGEHVTNRQGNVTEDVNQTGPGTSVTVSDFQQTAHT
jgi:hypothetical protein